MSGQTSFLAASKIIRSISVTVHPYLKLYNSHGWSCNKATVSDIKASSIPISLKKDNTTNRHVLRYYPRFMRTKFAYASPKSFKLLHLYY